MHLDYKPEDRDRVVDIPATDINLPVNLPANLPVKQRAILEELQTDSTLTYEALAKIIGCSRETARVHIKALVKAGYLTRIGSDKTGHWQINKISHKS